MANMSYCRFENTASDLLDCEEHLMDAELSQSEQDARNDLIETCQRILDEWAKYIDSDTDE
jgi:hypothetical protein